VRGRRAARADPGVPPDVARLAFPLDARADELRKPQRAGARRLAVGEDQVDRPGFFLRLNSSVFREGGQSSRRASQFVARFAGARVIQRDFLAFLGVTDVQFVHAEGLAIGEAQKQAALAAADRALRELAQTQRIAA
jgi:hypothetical protein